MIAGASITDERKGLDLLPTATTMQTRAWQLQRTLMITGFDDLKGKKVAVKTASMSADYAESIKDQYGFEITYFEDSPTMYQAVVGGQVAACFDDTPDQAKQHQRYRHRYETGRWHRQRPG